MCVPIAMYMFYSVDCNWYTYDQWTHTKVFNCTQWGPSYPNIGKLTPPERNYYAKPDGPCSSLVSNLPSCIDQVPRAGREMPYPIYTNTPGTKSAPENILSESCFAALLHDSMYPRSCGMRRYAGYMPPSAPDIQVSNKHRNWWGTSYVGEHWNKTSKGTSTPVLCVQKYQHHGTCPLASCSHSLFPNNPGPI